MKLRKITVDVNEECMRLGNKKETTGHPRSQNCPISRALQAAGIVGAMSSGSMVHTRGESIRLPVEVSEVMHALDRGDSHEPFKFVLEVPEQYLKQEYQSI